MNILVLNSGSSSLKCALYAMQNTPEPPGHPLWEAELQWKNSFEDLFLNVKNAHGAQRSEALSAKTTGQALRHLLRLLFEGETAVLNALSDVAAVGHRIVHGGPYFQESVRITPEVKEKIRLVSTLAPLHNMSELETIDALGELIADTPQFAVFDTAFHHTLGKAAQIYPVPYHWYEEGIRRYGFHGISFQYCYKRSSTLLQQDPAPLKMVVCHLGAGASLCAIHEGKSIDTTMGFTPLDGLMMDTRSGSVDPGIILYLLQKKKKTAEEIAHELYHESGLLGISGISSDMREILKKHVQGDARADLALDVYTHRLNALIGSMTASLKGLDVLIFTGGIGENTPLIRERACDTFAFLGVRLDKIKNTQDSAEDRILSAADAKVKVLLIHTQEAFEIAGACWTLLQNQP